MWNCINDQRHLFLNLTKMILPLLSIIKLSFWWLPSSGIVCSSEWLGVRSQGVTSWLKVRSQAAVIAAPFCWLEAVFVVVVSLVVGGAIGWLGFLFDDTAFSP